MKMPVATAGFGSQSQPCRNVCRGHSRQVRAWVSLGESVLLSHTWMKQKDRQVNWSCLNERGSGPGFAHKLTMRRLERP